MRFAIDPGYAEFDDDRAFDPAIHRRYPGTRTWLLIKRELEAAGAEVRTADRYGREREVTDVGVIAHGLARPANQLLARGARGTVLVCWEAPVVAWDFYRRLPALSRRYGHVFSYEGARRRSRSPFHRTFLPQPRRTPPSDSWADRGFLAIVNSNIRPRPPSVRALVGAIAVRLRGEGPAALRPSVRQQLVALTDRDLGAELYSERLRLIEVLAAIPGVDLYGRGWDRAGPQHVDVPAGVRAIWRGAVDDKDAALRRYRFALCVENAEFPGYITEKIFDVLASGAIPVYLGAPDVTAHIPSECFVHVRDHAGDGALIARLRGMGVEEAERMRAAARRFLASPGFDPFAEDRIAREIAEAALDA